MFDAPAPDLDVSSPNLPPAGLIPPAVFSDAESLGVTAKWTVERCELLIKMKEGRATWPEITLGINGMPGGLLTQKGIENKYYVWRGRAKAKPALKTAAAHPPVPSTDGGVVKVTPAQAEQWAAQRGLCNGIDGVLDMAAINAKRFAFGLSPFELLQGRA